MEDAVDVVEQVFLAYLLAGVGALEMRQASVGDSIAANFNRLLGRKI